MEGELAMNTEPFDSYPKPDYPSLEEFQHDQNLADSPLPLSWRKKAFITGAFLAFSAFSCQEALPQDATSLPKEPSIVVSFENTTAPFLKEASQWLLAAATQKAVIAPLFLHGNGTGSSGGIAARPLSTLTEDEARSLIEGELKKAGITFDRHKVEVKGVTVEDKSTKEKVPLVADGLDSKHNIAYEYVPAKEYDKISKTQKGTLTEVNYRNLAEKVRDAFMKACTVSAAVFYDPMPSGLKKSDAEKLLRCQVQDFIKWVQENKLVR